MSKVLLLGLPWCLLSGVPITVPVKLPCIITFYAFESSFEALVSRSSNSFHQQCKVRLLRNMTVSCYDLMISNTAELHDEKHQPDMENGRSFGMPLDTFTEEAYQGLVSGKEEVVVEQAKKWYDAFEPKRQEVFYNLVEVMKSSK